MFRPNILPKKVWVPTKRKFHFSGPNIAPKKVRVQKNISIFSGQKLCHKKYGCQKKCKKKYELQKHGHSDSYFFGPNIVTKKYGFQKKRNSYFFRPNIVPERKYGFQKKRMSSKRNIIFVRAEHCANKSMSSKKTELILFSGQTLCQKK